MMSLARMQVAIAPYQYTSPEDAGPEHSHQAFLNLLGIQSRRPRETACPLSITHVECYQEWYHEIHSVMAYSQRKTPTRLKIMSTTDCKKQQEAIAPLWLPHIHTEHTSREKVLRYSGFLSGHPGLKHSSATEKYKINDRWETARSLP